MTDRTSFQSYFGVSRETIARLETYEALLKKWNSAINLVSPRTISDIWSRHFLDSAQIFSLLPENAKSWADIGSGGGFPGMVVAILAAEKRPDLFVTLVESDRRKAAFLMTAAREMSLKLQVVSDRIEAISPLNADVLSARALAPLADLLAFAERHLAATGVCLFPKGARWREELAEAQKTWSFIMESHKSRTDSEAVILKIEGIERV